MTGEAPPVAETAPASGETGAGTSEPGLDAISRGDLAWWQGDRRTAQEAWKAALSHAIAGERGIDRAVEVMARVRLLQVSGTAGPFVHERRLRDAEAACPRTEPWCAVARADDDLFMPAFTGADPRGVPARLAGSPLVGPASARVALATGDRAALASPELLDGLGQGLAASPAPRPPDPGTWALSLGVGGAPGAGVGASVRLVHPDVGWKGHLLDVTAAGDSLGGWNVAAGFLAAPAVSHPSAPRLQASGGTWREVGYLWSDAGVESYRDTGGRLSLGALSRVREGTLRGGVSARVDDIGDGPAAAAGPYASWTTGTRQARVTGAVEVAGGSYTHAALSVDARAFPPLAGGTVALHGLATVVPTPESPFYRLPAAGGSTLLRGAPAGRHRGDTLVAGQVEYRHPLVGPLEGVAFLDTARVGGPWAWTAGGGLHLVLPPEETNVTRIDVGVGPGGWGVVVGWGEAF